MSHQVPGKLIEMVEAVRHAVGTGETKVVADKVATLVVFLEVEAIPKIGNLMDAIDAYCDAPEDEDVDLDPVLHYAAEFTSAVSL